MMINDKSNWVKNPNKKQVIVLSIIWLVGLTFMLMAMTNFFAESPFQRKNLSMAFLISLVTYTVFSVYRNYFKNKSKT
jgi:K+-sensing histidine kinase KdpD